MDAKLPIVAQPGAATVATFRREGGNPVNSRRKGYASARRESRRVSCATQNKIFAGYTQDPRDAESLLKPEIAWCEQNCRGLWSIIYGPHIRGLGYEIRFGFTDEADSKEFARYRTERRDLRESGRHNSGEL